MAKEKFKNILENLDGDNKALAESLVAEIVFMRGILDKLKKAIKDNGVVDVYPNGEVKDSALVKSYNMTVQRYGSLVKQLEFMIRTDGKIPQGENALQEWLKTVK